MRILWVADKIGYGKRLHGVGAYFKYVIPEISTHSIIPVALRCDPSLQEQLRGSGLDLRVLRHYVGDPRTLFALLRIVRSENIDLLHLHGYGAAAFGRIVAKISGRPAILHQHDSASSPHFHGRAADFALRHCMHGVVAVSETVADFCTRTRSIERSKICVIPNPMPTIEPHSEAAVAEFRAEFGILQGARLVGSITRFDAVKGNRYLVLALEKIVRAVPDVVLVFFGDGDERAELEQLVATLGLQQHVRFAGFRPDAARFLAAMDCFALPSLNEGVPFALLESWYAGTPAVVTAVGGIPDIVEEGDNAILVAPRDASALAAGIRRVLTDDSLAGRLRDGGRDAGAELGLDRHIEKLLALYDEAAGRAAARQAAVDGEARRQRVHQSPGRS